VLDRGPDPHTSRGNFEGEKGLLHDMLGSQYTQSNSAGAESLASPGEYN